ncbi:Actin-related protein 2, partial [Tropilaelaps mercedesae]
MASSCEKNLIVCDNGTGFVKCGYAGMEIPSFTFPNLVGRPALRAMSDAGAGFAAPQHVAVGDEASRSRSILNVNYPMERGAVRNWDEMIEVWNYAFGPQKMNVEPADSKILLTEPPMGCRRSRERMVEIMFENYGFDAVYVAMQAILTLYAQGLYTGVVVDSGDGVTFINPVYGGCECSYATKRFDVAGRDITRRLVELLLRRGYVFNQSVDFETARLIKERLCYIAHDFRLEQRLALETTAVVESYALPDGRQIRVGAERYEAPEILFRPWLIGMESPGIAELVFDSIQSMDVDIRADLYTNVVLSGGTTMFPGLPTRLERELKQLYIERVRAGDAKSVGRVVRVKTLPNRMDAVFIG